MEDLRKNKITIKGQEFYYRLMYENSEYGCGEWTEFYKVIKTKTVKRFILFGPYVTIEEPEVLFKVWFWITNPNYTKENLRKKLETEMELLHRKEEIERGELI